MKGTCCSFSSTVMTQLWVGATLGTVFLFDIAPVISSIHSNSSNNNGAVRTLNPSMVFNLQPSMNISQPKPPIQGIGHISGRAGCFCYPGGDMSGQDNTSITELLLLTQGGRVWVLEGGPGKAINQAAACCIDFFDLNRAPVAPMPIYDVRVSDIAAPALPAFCNGVDLNRGKTRTIACLLGASKPASYGTQTAPAQVYRFLLERVGRSWQGVILSQCRGHSFSYATPRPIAGNISLRPLADGREGREEENMLLMACPDESKGSFHLWLQHLVALPGAVKAGCVSAETLPHTVSVNSPVLSIALAKVGQERGEVEVHGSGQGPGQGGGPGRVSLRLVIATVETVLVYSIRS
jgi:hypothetical protein